MIFAKYLMNMDKERFLVMKIQSPDVEIQLSYIEKECWDEFRVKALQGKK